MRPLSCAAVAVALACLLLAGAPVVSGQTLTDTTYTVALEPDGNATVTLTYAFDLETSAEAAAFDELEADRGAREQLADEFQTQMSGVAERTAGRTNRSMAVDNATVSFDRAETVGTVHVRVEWANLARVTDDGGLTLSEPFASSFTPEGAVRVTAPTDHSISSVTPDPAQQTVTTVTWDANATLSGFTVVTAPTQTPTATPTATAETSPGFGPALAVLATLLFVAWVVRH
jgi:hypothetical protein